MKKFDRVTKILLSLLVVGVWGVMMLMVLGFPIAKASPAEGDVSPVIRTKGIVIVDDKGRERVILGAPVPDPPKEGKRINPAHGMIIVDEQGYERWGVGLMDNGQMAMGFDAPRGKGDDRNRERLHFIADPEGGATIRFLNKKTSVPGRLTLGDDDNLYLEFIDVQKDKNKVVFKRIGMNGEKTTEEPFRK